MEMCTHDINFQKQKLHYSVMTHGQNFFDQRIQNDKITNNNIKHIETGQGEEYTTECLLHYIFFSKNIIS